MAEDPIEFKSEILSYEEKLRRSGVASSKMTRLAHRKQFEGIRADDPEKYWVDTSVFCPKEWDMDGASLDKIVERAKREGVEIAIYRGGINWRGGKVIRDAHGSEKMKRRFDGGLEKFSPESKVFETKISVLNFLADAGKKVVVTIDPGLAEGKRPKSLLRAEWLAERAVMEKLSEEGVGFERICWSDGGFKDLQTQLAGLVAIVEDLQFAAGRDMVSMDRLAKMTRGELKDLLKLIAQGKPERKRPKQYHLEEPVFVSGWEAVKYFETLKDVVTLRGGVPDGARELAHPIKSTDINKLKSDILRPMMNNLIILVGTNEANPIVQMIINGVFQVDTIKKSGDMMVVYRLLELGRGKSVEGSGIESETIECRVAQRLVRDVLGEGMDGVLADTSGEVVNSASPWAGAASISRFIWGEKKAVFVETNDQVGHIMGDSQHRELKRLGTIANMEALVWMYKKGLFFGETKGYGGRRYEPVDLGKSWKHKNGSTMHMPLQLDAKRWTKIKRNELGGNDLKMYDRARDWIGEVLD